MKEFWRQLRKDSVAFPSLIGPIIGFIVLLIFLSWLFVFLGGEII